MKNKLIIKIKKMKTTEQNPLKEALHLIDVNRYKTNSIKEHLQCPYSYPEDYTPQLIRYLTNLVYDLNTIYSILSNFVINYNKLLKEINDSNLAESEINRLNYQLDKAANDLRNMDNDNDSEKKNNIIKHTRRNNTVGGGDFPDYLKYSFNNKNKFGNNFYPSYGNLSCFSNCCCKNNDKDRDINSIRDNPCTNGCCDYPNQYNRNNYNNHKNNNKKENNKSNTNPRDVNTNNNKGSTNKNINSPDFNDNDDDNNYFNNGREITNHFDKDNKDNNNKNNRNNNHSSISPLPQEKTSIKKNSKRYPTIINQTEPDQPLLNDNQIKENNKTIKLVNNHLINNESNDNENNFVNSILNRNKKIQEIISELGKDKNKEKEIKQIFGDNIEEQLINGDVSDENLEKIQNIIKCTKKNISIIPMSKRFQIQSRMNSNNNTINNSKRNKSTPRYGKKLNQEDKDKGLRRKLLKSKQKYDY